MLFIISVVVFFGLLMMISDVYRPISMKNIQEGKFMPVNTDTLKVFAMLLGANAVTDFIAVQHVNLVTDVFFSIFIMGLWTFIHRKQSNKL